MNQAQRNFLVQKIEETVKAKVNALKDNLPERPNLANYMFHKIMSNDFDLQDKEVMKKMLIDRCVNTPDGKEWNSSRRGWSNDNKIIEFNIRDIFIIPKEFQDKIDQYDTETRVTHQEINLIQAQSETLIVRIKLASNSTLETMIQEVDDMGNLSLMDTKLKAITS